MQVLIPAASRVRNVGGKAGGKVFLGQTVRFPTDFRQTAADEIRPMGVQDLKKCP